MNLKQDNERIIKQFKRNGHSQHQWKRKNEQKKKKQGGRKCVRL